MDTFAQELSYTHTRLWQSKAEKQISFYIQENRKVII
jgi:hypothetical protein